MTQNGNNRMIGRMFSYRVLRGYDKLSSPRPLSRHIWVKGNPINPYLRMLTYKCSTNWSMYPKPLNLF